MNKKTILDWLSENMQQARNYLEGELRFWRSRMYGKALSPWDISALLDIDLLEADLSEFQVRGFLKVMEQGQYQIFYDENLNTQQMRYTIMHEIVHQMLLQFYKEKTGEKIEGPIVFDMVRNLNVQLKLTSVVERVCDEYALEMLMPRELVDVFVKKTKRFQVKEIADYFGVEEELVKYRVKAGGRYL